MLHLPVLRAGRAYRSLDLERLHDIRTGEPLAEVSQANPGLIARDLGDAAARRRKLQSVPVAELLEICRRAARAFVADELPLDPAAGTTQSPEEYVNCLSATTGLPRALCRGNMKKIEFVLAEMERVLGGLTRGLDLTALDRGWVEQQGRPVSYLGQADMLGAVLPNNSPGVHALWIPAIALKVPLALRPGSQEPWTPMRIVQALIGAGCPPEAFGVYPSSYAGATELLLRCDRSLFFGDASTVSAWAHDTRVQLHGPGFSKVILGQDCVDDWRAHLELMATSVAENGGRSCVNASGVWVPRHGREIAEALAQRLVQIEARPLDDPQAALAAFSQPQMARRISGYIDQQLQIPGAVDLTAELRPAGRVAELDGCTFLLPTVIWCADREHPLARTELLFPFVSVVEVPQPELLDAIRPTLVVTAVTDDPAFRRELLTSRNVERLNLGAELPTSRVSWDQPHEGNLFEHLYRQRAFQAA